MRVAGTFAQLPLGFAAVALLESHLSPLRHLLKESRLNHLGKLMFQWFYWHSLLAGRDIPRIPSRMPMAGKETVTWPR